MKSITVPPPENSFSLDQSEQNLSVWETLRQLEYDIMETLIEASGQYLWFHAGAVAREGRAVLFAGKTGCGKSTISLGLCRPGGPWRFLGDDAIPFQIESMDAYAFLRTPWFRLGNGREMEPERLWELRKQDVELDEAMIGHGPARLALVIFPVYTHGGSLRHERVSGMSVAWDLVGCTFNLPAHGAAALQFAADVARQIPAYRIEYSNSQEAIDLIEEIWNGTKAAEQGGERLCKPAPRSEEPG